MRAGPLETEWFLWAKMTTWGSTWEGPWVAVLAAPWGGETVREWAQTSAVETAHGWALAWEVSSVLGLVETLAEVWAGEKVAM